MKLNRILLFGIFSGIVFTSCRDSNEAGRGFEVDESVDYERVEVEGEPEEENSVNVLIRRNGKLTTFAENLEKNQFQQNWGEISGRGTMTTNEQVQQTNSNDAKTSMKGYTLFAPSDDAFDRLPEDQRNAILHTYNREANLASINYLMVDQRLPQDQLKKLIKDSNGTYSLKTMQGENITATLNGEIIVLKDGKGNEASVVEINNQARDGVLYIIDGVLLPGDLTRNEALNRNMEE